MLRIKLMKTNISLSGSKFFLFMLVFLMAGCSRTIHESVQGTESSSGGGSGSIIEFRTYIARANRLIQNYGAYVLATEQRNKVDAIFLSHIVIESTDEDLRKDGQKVTALNYPKLKIKKVRFNEERWDQKDVRTKLQTTVHELLGLADIEDPDYTMSDKIISEDPHYKTSLGIYLPDDIVLAMATSEKDVFDAAILPEKTLVTQLSATDFIYTYFVQTYSLKMEPLKINIYKVITNNLKGVVKIESSSQQ